MAGAIDPLGQGKRRWMPSWRRRSRRSTGLKRTLTRTAIIVLGGRPKPLGVASASMPRAVATLYRSSGRPPEPGQPQGVCSWSSGGVGRAPTPRSEVGLVSGGVRDALAARVCRGQEAR
jgi:hypothetical protein